MRINSQIVRKIDFIALLIPARVLENPFYLINLGDKNTERATQWQKLKEYSLKK